MNDDALDYLTDEEQEDLFAWMDSIFVERMTFAEMFMLNQSAPIGHPFFKAGTDEADAFTVRFQSLASIVTPDDLRALADRMENALAAVSAETEEDT